MYLPDVTKPYAINTTRTNEREGLAVFLSHLITGTRVVVALHHAVCVLEELLVSLKGQELQILLQSNGSRNTTSDQKCLRKKTPSRNNLTLFLLLY